MPSTSYTPVPAHADLLDVEYPVEGGGFAPYSTVLVLQRAGSITPFPIHEDLLDVEYPTEGGGFAPYSPTVILQRAGSLTPVAQHTELLDVEYAVSGGAGAEGEARTISLVGPLIPVPRTTELISAHYISSGGSWGRGAARWQAANYLVNAAIGGVIAGGGASVLTNAQPRVFYSDPIIIDLGAGGQLQGSEPAVGDRGLNFIISLDGGSFTRPVNDGGNETTGGADPPIILGGFIPANANMTGTGGVTTNAVVHYLGGEIIFVGTPRPASPGRPWLPPHMTITVNGDFNTGGGGGGDGLGIYDPSYPGLGGWYGTDGLNIIPPSWSGYGPDFDLADFLTIIDNTTGGLPGGIFNPNPKPGASSAVFGTRGLHANLLSMVSALDAFTYGIRAPLTLVSSSIDAFVGARTGVSATLPKVTSSILATTGAGGAIKAPLPTLVCSLDDDTVGRAKLNAQLPLIRGAVTVAVSGVIKAPLLPVSARIVSATGGTIGANATLIQSALSADVIAAQLPLLACKFTLAAEIRAGLPLIRSHFAVPPNFGAIQEVLVTNTQTSAVSTYEGYPFNSFCEVDGVYFGASAAGLSRIETGASDGGAPISAGLSTGMIDFGNPMQKRVIDAFVTMRSSGDLTLTVTSDGAARQPAVDVKMVPRAQAGLVKYRGNIPKGLRGKTWQFELNNVAGSAFDFNGLDIVNDPVTRRV